MAAPTTPTLAAISAGDASPTASASSIAAESSPASPQRIPPRASCAASSVAPGAATSAPTCSGTARAKVYAVAISHFPDPVTPARCPVASMSTESRSEAA